MFFFFCNTGFSHKQYYYTPDVVISQGRESSTAKPFLVFFFFSYISSAPLLGLHIRLRIHTRFLLPLPLQKKKKW